MAQLADPPTPAAPAPLPSGFTAPTPPAAPLSPPPLPQGAKLDAAAPTAPPLPPGAKPDAPTYIDENGKLAPGTPPPGTYVGAAGKRIPFAGQVAGPTPPAPPPLPPGAKLDAPQPITIEPLSPDEQAAQDAKDFQRRDLAAQRPNFDPNLPPPTPFVHDMQSRTDTTPIRPEAFREPKPEEYPATPEGKINFQNAAQEHIAALQRVTDTADEHEQIMQHTAIYQPVDAAMKELYGNNPIPQPPNRNPAQGARTPATEIQYAQNLAKYNQQVQAALLQYDIGHHLYKTPEAQQILAQQAQKIQEDQNWLEAGGHAFQQRFQRIAGITHPMNAEDAALANASMEQHPSAKVFNTAAGITSPEGLTTAAVTAGAGGVLGGGAAGNMAAGAIFNAGAETTEALSRNEGPSLGSLAKSAALGAVFGGLSPIAGQVAKRIPGAVEAFSRLPQAAQIATRVTANTANTAILNVGVNYAIRAAQGQPTTGADIIQDFATGAAMHVAAGGTLHDIHGEPMKAPTPQEADRAAQILNTQPNLTAEQAIKMARGANAADKSRGTQPPPEQGLPNPPTEAPSAGERAEVWNQLSDKGDAGNLHSEIRTASNRDLYDAAKSGALSNDVQPLVEDELSARGVDRVQEARLEAGAPGQSMPQAAPEHLGTVGSKPLADKIAAQEGGVAIKDSTGPGYHVVKLPEQGESDALQKPSTESEVLRNTEPSQVHPGVRGGDEGQTAGAGNAPAQPPERVGEVPPRQAENREGAGAVVPPLPEGAKLDAHQNAPVEAEPLTYANTRAKLDIMDARKHSINTERGGTVYDVKGTSAKQAAATADEFKKMPGVEGAIVVGNRTRVFLDPLDERGNPVPKLAEATEGQTAPQRASGGGEAGVDTAGADRGTISGEGAEHGQAAGQGIHAGDETGLVAGAQGAGASGVLSEGERVAQRTRAVAGIRKAAERFRGVTLHDDGTNLHLEMPDKSRIPINLRDAIDLRPEHVKNFLQSALAANGGGTSYRHSQTRGTEKLPANLDEWNQLTPDQKRHLTDEWEPGGHYTRKDGEESIDLTHAGAGNPSVAGEEIFHAQAARLKQADPETYRRTMKYYENEDAAFHGTKNLPGFWNTPKSGKELFKRIREGRAGESPAVAKRPLTAMERNEAMVMGGAMADGVLMSDHDLEAFVNDAGGLHPDVLDTHRLRDEEGNIKRRPDGSPMLDAVGRKLEKFVDEDGYSNAVANMGAEAADKYQQRIIDEVSLTKRQKIEMAAEHYMHPEAPPEMRAAAEKVLGRKVEMPEQEEVPFAVRQRENPETQLTLAGEREGRETVGRTRPMFSRDEESPMPEPERPAVRDEVAPPPVLPGDLERMGVSKMNLHQASKFSEGEPSAAFAAGVKMAMFGRDFKPGNMSEYEAKQARAGFDAAGDKMTDAQRQFAAGMRRHENPPAADARDARIAKKFGGTESGSMFAVRKRNSEGGYDEPEFQDLSGVKKARGYNPPPAAPKEKPVEGAAGTQESMLPKGEPGEGGNEVTGIRNSISAKMRQEMGWPDRDSPEHKPFTQMMQEGLDLAKNTNAVPDLIDRINKTPGYQATPAESALMLKHRIDLENELQRLRGVRDEHATNGNKEGEELAWAQMRMVDEQRRKATDTFEKAGTPLGQALAARAMMAKMDYSLSHMQNVEEASRGRPLTNEETIQLEKEHDALKAAHADAVKQLAVEGEKRANAEAERDHANLLREAAEKKLAERPTRLASKAKDYGASNKLFTRERYEKAKAKLRDTSQLYSAFPVDKLQALTEMAAYHIEAGARSLGDFTAKMVGDLGEKIRPQIQTLFDSANQAIQDEKNKSLTEKMKARVKDGATPDELQPYLRQMALDLINGGIKEREPLLDALHENVKEVFPGITREEVRDTLSGFGKSTPLTKDAAKLTLGHINQQSQKLAQLEHLRKQIGLPADERTMPPATGAKRLSPDQETRELTRQYNDLKKELGIQNADPETQLKSTFASMKTRARNLISDLQTEIDLGVRNVKGKSVPISDAELDTLRKQLADTRKAHKAIFGNKDLTDEQRLSLATKAAQRNLETWSDRLDKARKGVFNDPSTKRSVTNEEVNALRAKTEAARQEVKELRDQDPAYKASQDAKADQAARTRAATKEADLRDRMARGDYTPKSKPDQRLYSDDTLRAQAKAKRLQNEFDAKQSRIQEKNRPLWWKIMEHTAGIARAGALSGYHTLGKLASFTGAKLAEIPATEAAGKMLDLVPKFKKIGMMAPHEGGESIRALGKLYTGFAVDGMRRAAQQLRTGTTESQSLYGKGPVEGRSKTPHWYDFFGNLHAAEKAPLLTGAERMILEKAMTRAIANGQDVSNDLVQGAIRKGAFDEANRHILQEPNAFADLINQGTGRLEAPNKETGKLSIEGHAISALVKTFITKGIVKTPANYVMQTLERTPLGLARGLLKAAVSEPSLLKPQEADAIRRLLKVGLVGSAMFAWGMMDALKKKEDRVFGGYYQPGENRDPDDVRFAGIRVAGHNIPHIFTHSPMTESAQMGSTMMRVAMSYLSKKDRENAGVVQGVIASVLGLIQQAPVANSAFRLNLGDPQKRASVVSSLLVGLVPMLAQNVAQDTDAKDDKGEPVHRKPVGVIENLEKVTPGLQSKVPLAVPEGTKAQTRTSISEAYKTDPNAGHEAAAKAVKDGILSQVEADKLAKDAGGDPSLIKIAGPLSDAIPNYDRFSDADKAKYAPRIAEKIANSKSFTAAEQDQLFKDHGITPPADLALTRERDALKEAARPDEERARQVKDLNDRADSVYDDFKNGGSKDASLKQQTDNLHKQADALENQPATMKDADADRLKALNDFFKQTAADRKNTDAKIADFQKDVASGKRSQQEVDKIASAMNTAYSEKLAGRVKEFIAKK